MITNKELKTLLASQQGELDGVAMYQALAKVVKSPREQETFQQLAREEGHHAAVFHKLTGKKLTARKWKGTALTVAYRLLGKKRLYPLIAQGEYSAEKTYAPVVERFPEVRSVQADEKRHGDTVMGLLKSTTYDSSVQKPLIHKSICTGETTAGFKDLKTGKYTDVMLIRTEDDLKTFMDEYGIKDRPETEY